jgi:hypothetical protein
VGDLDVRAVGSGDGIEFGIVLFGDVGNCGACRAIKVSYCMYTAYIPRDNDGDRDRLLGDLMEDLLEDMGVVADTGVVVFEPDSEPLAAVGS